MKCKGKDHACIEYFVGSNHRNLWDFMLNNKMSEEDRIKIYIDLVDVVEYLHGKQLVLCAINPLSIFIVDEKRVGALMSDQ